MLHGGLQVRRAHTALGTAFAGHIRPVPRQLGLAEGVRNKGSVGSPLLAVAFSRHPRELEGSKAFSLRKQSTAVILLALRCTLNTSELAQLDALDSVAH